MPDEVVTEADVQEPPKLARLVLRLLKDVAQLKRAWTPDRVDFEDRVVDGTGVTLYRFEHGLGGRVRWWVVDSTGPHDLVRDASSDNNTLVLYSYGATTVTIRVERAG